MAVKGMFTAMCELCKGKSPRCAAVGILGTNVYGDREWRFFDAVCTSCRQSARKVWFHPRHRSKVTPAGNPQR